MNSTALEGLFAFAPSLIIGERACTAAADRASKFADILRKAEVRGFSVIPQYRESPGLFFDSLRSWDETKATILEGEYLADILSLTPALDISHLASVRWSAVVSLAGDTSFEQALQSQANKTPSGRSVTVVSHPSITLPLRTTPVFKLLGDPSASAPERRLALGTSDITLRKQAWGDLLSQFSDRAKHGAVLILGFNEADSVLQDCLATLLSIKGPIPKRFYFIGQRPAVIDPTLAGILRRRAEVNYIDCSLRDFCHAASQRTTAAAQVALPPGIPEKIGPVIAGFLDSIAVPSTELPAGFIVSQRITELGDALFRPTAVDWRPFVADLDLKRDQTQEVLQATSELLGAARKGNWPTLSIRGEAGVGKTTFLKRIALELAKRGVLVCWVRKQIATSAISNIKGIARKVLATIGDANKKVDLDIAFICDDPIELDVDPEDVVLALETIGLSALTMVATRTSDELTQVWNLQDKVRYPLQEIKLNYELTVDELRGLETFLVQHRAAVSADVARKMIGSTPGNSAKDILCSLWFLVPATRSQLEASLENEYLRLGSTKPAIESLAQEAGRYADIAKRAYEAVAVSSSLDLQLPVEVLVRAIAAGSYEEWIELNGEGKPLWGLLYDVVDKEVGVLAYRTRNLVVTEVLVRLIDGAFGHSGRLRVLKTLVTACAGGGLIYRNFLNLLLVRRREKLASWLHFDEGTDLYDLALAEDSQDQALLLHHKAIWIRTKGADPETAYLVMQAALAKATSDMSQSESKENIHVSMASAVADKLGNKRIAPADALESVLGHLGEARLRRDFDPHVPYVMARTFLQLAKNSNSLPTTVEAACRALSEIDRGLLTIGGSPRSQARYFHGVERLFSLQRAVASMFDDTDLAEISKQVEASGSLSGSELRARLLLRRASISKKGSDYNEIMQIVDAALATMPVEPWQRQLGMRETRATTMIRWRLAKPRGAVDWVKFSDDVQYLLRSPQYSIDPLWHYYSALARFQHGDITASISEFNALRPMLRGYPNVTALRNFYLDKDGHPEQFQAQLHIANHKRYVSIEKLGIDAEAPPECPANLREGDTTHCYLVFRLAGYRAYFGNPEEMDLELAGDTN